MKAKIKKCLPLTLGGVCFGVALLVPFLVGFDRIEIDVVAVLVWFALIGGIFMWTAFRRTAELEVTPQVISIRGCHFDRSNIVSARVFRVRFSGGRGRYIELQFKEMPRLSVGWKMANMLERLGFPEKCEKGIPIAKESRIISPLNHTDMSDDDLNRELRSE